MRDGAKKSLARRLRAGITDAESKLWRHLRLRQIEGCRFRRQHPLGPYVVDFVCIEMKLIVEVDGSQHMQSRHDAQRDGWLIAQGFRVLRFWNHEILLQTDAVAEAIWNALIEIRPLPNLPPQAGEGNQQGAS